MGHIRDVFSALSSSIYCLCGRIFNCNVLLRRWILYWLLRRGSIGWVLHCMCLLFGCIGNGIIDGYVGNAIGGIISMISGIHSSRSVGERILLREQIICF